MRISRYRAALAVIALLACATPASADITGFLGLTPTPTNRAVRGLAVSGGLLVVGFEFEYSNTSEKLAETAADEHGPALQTGMFNVVLQTPIPVGRTQFYATAGGGIYRETLNDVRETNIGINVGGGAKIRLAGPLRLRLDYRLFTLRGEPLNERYHRVYAGLNLGF